MRAIFAGIAAVSAFIAGNLLTGATPLTTYADDGLGRQVWVALLTALTFAMMFGLGFAAVKIAERLEKPTAEVSA